MKKNLYLVDHIDLEDEKKPILLLGDWLINKKLICLIHKLLFVIQ